MTARLGSKLGLAHEPFGLLVHDEDDMGAQLKSVKRPRNHPFRTKKQMLASKPDFPFAGDWILRVGEHNVTRDTQASQVVSWLKEAQLKVAAGCTCPKDAEGNAPASCDCDAKNRVVVAFARVTKDKVGSHLADNLTSKMSVTRMSETDKDAESRTVSAALILSRPFMRIWSDATRVPAINPLLEQPGAWLGKCCGSRAIAKQPGRTLCHCIPSDPHSDSPRDEHLCRRGKAHWELLSFKTRLDVTTLGLGLLIYAPIAQKVRCTHQARKRHLFSTHHPFVTSGTVPVFDCRLSVFSTARTSVTNGTWPTVRAV